MSTNLVESIKSIFTSEVISKTSNHLGENESGVNRAINAIVPVLLGGLLDKSSTPPGANTVSQWAQNEVAPGSFRNPLRFFEAAGATSDDRLLQTLFGPKATTVTDMVSNYAAVKPASTRSLWGMIGPVVLGFIGNYAAANKVNPAGIAALLNDQKENIRQAVPAGLNLGAVMAGNDDSHAAHVPPVRHATTAAVHHERVEEEEGSGIGWGVVILLMALLGAGAWYMGHDSSKHEAAASHGSPTVAHASASAPAAASAGAHHASSVTTRESLKVRLANGTEIDAYRGGIEEKMVMFLNTDYKALGEDSLKKVWFDFDNLNFKTASAELTPESQQQVDNMVAILKAYPKATLKIGGYTDRVGDEASNKRLSTARANTVKDALTKAGVGAQVTGAEGYGSSFAKHPATASEAERLTDRRVSVSVR